MADALIFTTRWRSSIYEINSCMLSLILWTAQRQPAAHQNVETILNITQQEGSLKLIQTDKAVTWIKLQVQSCQK